MSSEHRIRRAGLQDAPEIAYVHVQSWRTAYEGLIPRKIIEYHTLERRQQHWEGVLSREGSPEHVFVAEGETGIVGFASGGPERGDLPGFDGELYAIYVLTEFRRIGVGRRLTKAVMADLEGRRFTSAVLWVLAENPAVAFYQNLGARQIGSREISLGGRETHEVALGWRDIRKLTHSDREPSATTRESSP